MSETNYPIGRLLRSGITGFVAGCPIVEQERPSFGALVRAPLGPNDSIYGVVHELSILDDGLVRQLVTRDQPVDATVIADNRVNRTVPMEISVLAVGHSKDGAISHALAPRAPLSLDAIHQCSPEEIVAFTNHGSFGYLRHLLRDTAGGRAGRRPRAPGGGCQRSCRQARMEGACHPGADRPAAG